MSRERGVAQITQTEDIVSVFDPEVIFTIRKAGNREDIERKNFFSKVRYVPQESVDDAYITERDFPMGDLELLTVRLCLVSWNILENGMPVKINSETVMNLLQPVERVQLYEAIIAFNQELWGVRTPTNPDAKKD